MKTFTEPQVAKIIVSDRRANAITPSAEFTAIAGQDHGYVRAWSVGEHHGYAIQYGNRRETSYAMATDTDDLAKWLESPDLDALQTAIQSANIRCIDAVRPALDSDEGPFYILVTRFWNDNTETTEVMQDWSNGPREFESRERAQDRIDEGQAQTYVLSHNEEHKPAYKIISVQ